MSQIGWIDFSPEDRGKVKTILSMLSEPGTLDELGIGQIRDSFSNLLFPGISTIQTRAKYFIILPRIFRNYFDLTFNDRKKVRSLQEYLADCENEVARILVDAHDESEPGIVGRTRVDSGGVDRKPSLIYWNGLRTFELLKTSRSLGDFCNYLENKDLLETENSEDDEDVQRNNNFINLPDNNPNWMDNLKINLTSIEAEYLKGKMTESVGLESTVITQLFKHDLIDKVITENSNENIENFDLLVELMLKNDVDETCRNHLKLAKDFSLAMEGPHIRYNILLTENNSYSEKAESYKEEYKIWLEKVREKDLFSKKTTDEWLSITGKRKIKSRTTKFIYDWTDAIINNSDESILDRIVENQAISNKGARSLLNRKLEDDRWQGIRRLDYRWHNAKTIIKDIKEVLNART